MPYTVEITYRYKIYAVSAKDAFQTVPGATSIKWPHAKGSARVINDKGNVVLTAILKNSKKRKI